MSPKNTRQCYCCCIISIIFQVSENFSGRLYWHVSRNVFSSLDWLRTDRRTSGQTDTKILINVFFVANFLCENAKKLVINYNSGSHLAVVPMQWPGSSVGIATDYGLDGPGSNPGGDENFPPLQTGPGAHPVSCTMGTGSFPGVEAAGAWGWPHPPPSRMPKS